MNETENPFHGAKITVASKRGEKLALRAGYVAVPGERTRLEYYVDDALKGAGFKVEAGLNPSGGKLVHDPGLRLVTGPGPQTIDVQAETIRSTLSSLAASSTASGSRTAPPTGISG